VKMARSKPSILVALGAAARAARASDGTRRLAVAATTGNPEIAPGRRVVIELIGAGALCGALW